ncbi:MAG: HD-GYP domain-containing protein [Planctomycetota bacterium]|nr:MAG: HD-GYP domain-containing protein [Planctomycetota bacterium]
MSLLRPGTHQPVPRELVARCHELGLLTWRLDANGLPMEEPDAPELLAMWMSSKQFRAELTTLASAWSGMDTPQAVEPRPGMWVFPFEEVHRRRRTGYVVAIGFGREILESDLLEPSCVGGSLQLSAVRHQLAAHATLNERCAQHLSSSLRWMFNDLTRSTKDTQTIGGFTEQLGFAYETVTMLCELGRSMGSIDDPMSFIRAVAESLAETLQYGWVAVRLTDENGDKVHQYGSVRLDDGELGVTIARIDSGEPDAVAGSTQIYGVDDPSSRLGPQVVCHPIERAGKRFGMIIAGGKAGDDPQVSTYETKSFESLTGLLGAFLENVGLYEEQRQTFLGTIRAMSGALDAKDRYTRGHSDRVAHLSEGIARSLGFDEDEAKRVHLAGILHDIGKIGVPESVLCKPGRLTDEEFGKIKLHPEIGHEILKGIPSLRDVLPGVLHHHERYDGRGYPHGLAGEDIPLLARIIGVADTFDAMSSNRAYHSKMPREVVLAEIRKCSGSQFDPRVAEAFLTLDLSEYDRMVADHASQDAFTQAA